MSEFNVNIEAGKSLRLLTAGKYCDRNILVKASGTSVDDSDILPIGYKRVSYIEFNGDQIVDTGIICNQNTKIRAIFTRETSTAMYLYGVASSDNTASVTAYLSSGGSWRFGNNSASYTITVNPDLIQTAIVDKTGIERPNASSAAMSSRRLLSKPFTLTFLPASIERVLIFS